MLKREGERDEERERQVNRNVVHDKTRGRRSNKINVERKKKIFGQKKFNRALTKVHG